MEIVSASASLLSILEAAVSISKAATDLYHNLREAPKELAHLSSRIVQTQSRLNIQLHLYRSLSSDNLDSVLPVDAIKALEIDLNDAKTTLGIIQGSVSARAGQPNATQRVGWVCHKKPKVKKLLENLRDIDNNLSAMLTTLSV